MGLRTFVFMAVNVFSAFCTMFTSFRGILFISSNANGLLFSTKPIVYSKDVTADKVLLNISLLGLFVIIHSVFALSSIKQFSSHLGLSPLHRSFYNMATCLCLEVLMRNWLVLLPDLPLFWNLSGCDTFEFACQILHLVGWLSICCTVYILDFTEFIGTKQVQYFVRNLGCPMSAKTAQAQSFFKNMRHPVVCGPLVVLWLVPCMTIDRFLLSSVFTMYLLHGSRLNEENYRYIQQMYARKRHSIVYAHHSRDD